METVPAQELFPHHEPVQPVDTAWWWLSLHESSSWVAAHLVWLWFTACWKNIVNRMTQILSIQKRQADNKSALTQATSICKGESIW